jgi:hypothetical protein
LLLSVLPFFKKPKSQDKGGKTPWRDAALNKNQGEAAIGFFSTTHAFN